VDSLPFAFVVAVSFGLVAAVAAYRPERWIGAARIVLLGIVIATGVAVAVLVRVEPPGLRLTIDPSTEPLLPRNDPAREVYQKAVLHFGEDEVFVIAMETDDIFLADRLQLLREVTDWLARLPEVRRVQSLTDVVAFQYDHEGDYLDITSLIEDIPEDPAELAALRERTLRDPLYQRTLVSDDGGTAAVNVTFRRMTDAEFIASGLDAKIEAHLASLATPGVSFHVAGRAHVKDAVYHGMLRDLRLLIPMALLVVAIGLGIVFGTRRGVLLPVGLIAVSTIWTFAAMAFLERSLTVLTVLLAPMLSAIGSVYGIHAVSRFEEEAAKAEDARSAAIATLRHLRLPVLLAGLTTMIGFGALLLTDVPAVFEVGAFSVLGVACLTLLSLVGIPPVLALLPLRSMGTRFARGLAAWLDERLAEVAAFAARHAMPVIASFMFLLLGCALAIPRIEIDTDYLSFFDPDVPVRVEFEAVNHLLAGAVPLFISIEGTGPGSFREPVPLFAIERLQEEAARIPYVSRTLSMVDTLKVMNRAMSKDDPAMEVLPETRGGAAELLFMAPKGDLDRYTNVNHGQANVLVRTGAIGTARVRETERALASAVAGAGFPEGMNPVVTGNAILLARSADGIAQGQPRTVGLAAVAIFILVLATFGRVRLALIAMVPNLAPVIAYFGMLGISGIPLSLPTSLIGSVALGIAIDDTIHFLVRYGEERRAGQDPAEAAHVAGRRIGRPIAITSVMLVAGFLVVALSGFATLRQFGVLSAATMTVGLVSDLLLLPALLVRARA
jgi:predicted RND superfamily exporter protein